MSESEAYSKILYSKDVELDEANHRVELLTRCIEKICVAGGMIRPDTFINGPQALQFGEEFAEYLNSQKENNHVEAQ